MANMIDNKQDSRQIQTASWLAIILVFGEGTEPYLGFRQHDGTGPGPDHPTPRRRPLQKWFTKPASPRSH